MTTLAVSDKCIADYCPYPVVYRIEVWSFGGEAACLREVQSLVSQQLGALVHA